uniref:EamA domain-containing protein n=1 Tax=Fibrocapsa japonica TaxID=94617 RepID=A0A7S2V1R2_9STRA|mmetsp:Transcript_20462/g.29618  ORF Transcript_20462/g.29618 Transcript_20462/m.29618 type:complete len:449 (+) Transcript_20462:99-1445(+)|eukprot:CAMPEP_0113942678 /NCGR_PEP_ID=MMETSP1339-20121228/8332_1 /TAXON_ID=94617 /ORGANISM="Fibrocapsa japonica" /LENGTH=448 /DNA_ID=CAMNT_0000947219 /DNA_START=40 /DNA_END=1386 /DNA_ORIENTATION=- /assembly_acc=CAM_ASM_000762
MSRIAFMPNALFVAFLVLNIIFHTSTALCTAFTPLSSRKCLIPTQIHGGISISRYRRRTRPSSGSLTSSIEIGDGLFATTPKAPQSDPLPMGLSSKIPQKSPTKLKSAIVGADIGSIAPPQHPENSLADAEQSVAFARFLALLASALCGTNFAAVKVLQHTVPLGPSAMLRFGLSALATSGIVLAQEIAAKKGAGAQSLEDNASKNTALLAGVEIGLWYSLGFYCQSVGLLTTEASKVSFFSSLAVVTVPLLNVVFRGVKLEAKSIMSIALASFGVALLDLGPELLPSFSTGELFALGQAITFGIGYWRLENASCRFPRESNHITAGLSLSIAMSSVLYVLLGLDGSGLGFPSVEDFTTWFSQPHVPAALLWTGLVSTAAAVFLETLALKTISATEVTILMTTIPLWSATFAHFTLGEVLTTTGACGGALIVMGCLVGNLNLDAKENL